MFGALKVRTAHDHSRQVDNYTTCHLSMQLVYNFDVNWLDHDDVLRLNSIRLGFLQSMSYSVDLM